jgi:hypothetical protein
MTRSTSVKSNQKEYNRARTAAEDLVYNGQVRNIRRSLDSFLFAPIGFCLFFLSSLGVVQIKILISLLTTIGSIQLNTCISISTSPMTHVKKERKEKN